MPGALRLPPAGFSRTACCTRQRVDGVHAWCFYEYVQFEEWEANLEIRLHGVLAIEEVRHRQILGSWYGGQEEGDGEETGQASDHVSEHVTRNLFIIKIVM